MSSSSLIARTSGAATLIPRYRRSAARVLMDEGWGEFNAGVRGGDKIARHPGESRGPLFLGAFGALDSGFRRHDGEGDREDRNGDWRARISPRASHSNVTRPISRVLYPRLHGLRRGRRPFIFGRLSPGASCDQPGRLVWKRDWRVAPPRRPYSVLLPVGFAVPSLLPGTRCALTAPFHPCLASRLRRTRRFPFCGTVPGVAPAGGYPAPCFQGARTFLSARQLRRHWRSGHPAC